MLCLCMRQHNESVRRSSTELSRRRTVIRPEVDHRADDQRERIPPIDLEADTPERAFAELRTLYGLTSMHDRRAQVSAGDGRVGL
jgi:hypothetical protein